MGGENTAPTSSVRRQLFPLSGAILQRISRELGRRSHLGVDQGELQETCTEFGGNVLG